MIFRPETKNSHKILKNFLILWLFAGVIAFIFMLMTIGIEKTHKNECIKWSDWEKSIEAHYILDWQRSQCEQFGIYFED